MKAKEGRGVSLKTERKAGKKKEQKEQMGKNGLCMAKGMAAAFAVTCILFIGYGIVLTYTDLSEETLPLVSLICTAISAAIAGYDWAACRKRKGLLWGSAAGGTYTALLYLITSLASDRFVLQLSGLMTLAVAMAAGAAGGVLGVSRK